jgi:hypothetical protein
MKIRWWPRAMLSLLNLPQEIAVGIDKASGNGRGARYEAESVRGRN